MSLLSTFPKTALFILEVFIIVVYIGSVYHVINH